MLIIDPLLKGVSFRSEAGSCSACSVTLVRGEKLTLVDTGHAGQRQALTAALLERGLTPSDIDVTVLTHSHWDHSQNHDAFPESSLLIHRDELRYARNPHRNDWATPRWTSAMLEFESRLEEVEDGYEIEPGVRIMDIRGHSAGTIAVAVDTDDGLATITGDGLQDVAVALSGVNPLVFWDEDAARKGIARVLETAETIYPGHDHPFRLVGGKAEYLGPKQLKLFGISLEGDGVAVDPAPRMPYVMQGIEEQRLD